MAIRVFVSSSHDSPAHQDRVLVLSDRLRAEGLDCRIDQYEHSPEGGWPLWCEEQVEQADLSLSRFRCKQPPGIACLPAMNSFTGV